MKSSRFYIVAVFILLLVSCSNSTPETVVLKFYDAIDNADLQMAKSYVVKESLPVFEVLTAMADLEQEDAIPQENDIIVAIKSTDINEAETNASIVIQLMTKDSTVVDELSFSLKKEDREWKVIIE